MHARRDRARTVAGLSLVGVGAVSILGIVTAEALYPGYSTAEQTISALGASGPSGPVQPAATVFNAAMVVSGALTLVSAAGLHRVFDRRLLTAVVTVTGLGIAGVGLFPEHLGAPHAVAALLAFGGGGLSALAVAVVLDGPFRYLSAAAGVVSLVALALFVGSAGPVAALGVGGVERWVAHPLLIWITGFGGYLLGRATPGIDAT